MVCKTKTINRAGGAYEAPNCKVYSITAESHILTGSEDSANRGYDPDYDLGTI